MTRRNPTTGAMAGFMTAVVAIGAVAVTLQESDAQPAATTLSAKTLSTTTLSTTALAAATTAGRSISETVTAEMQPSTDGLAAIRTDARFSVSVLDLTTGASLDYGSGSFDTASIVKVDILAALLHQHEEAGTELSGSEQALAAAMIQRSDDAAATALFVAVGAQNGLEAFNDTIGLTQTRVGSDGNWGLTQTTSADQIRLLRVVMGEDSILGAESQAYAEGLMSGVIDSQNFGVSAAADDADAALLKVGYLQRSATGLWDVTSIGQIVAGGDTYWVAVLSADNRTFHAGVELVEAAATDAVDAITTVR